MTLPAAFTLLGIMLVLSAVPSSSVALVVTRSATHGFANGAATSLGIVLGDLVFVSLAILGMSMLAETMGAIFAIVKYAGAGYLIWIGVVLIRSRGKVELHKDDRRNSAILTSFLSGLLLTLGDVKAIFFYASLFPLFVNFHSLSTGSIVMIVVVTIVAVGGVKLFYAFTAQKIMSRFQTAKSQKVARSAAGCVMVGAGTYLIVKA